MKVVADTGPLVAAINRRDRAHKLAAALISSIGRDLVVPAPVIVEVDQLTRARVSADAARSFLKALANGEHSIALPTPNIFRRAIEIELRFADLNIGLVDAAVMAIAEHQRAPILTFDFNHFRATRPAHGYWKLVVDESRYKQATR